MKRLKVSTLPANILEALAGFVEEMRLQPGDRLPAERLIAERLGVSRPIVREALGRWAALGIVETKNGRGTFLRQPITATTRHVVLPISDERSQLLETMEVRLALESEAAALAARRASPEQIAGLWRLLEAVERAYAERNDAPDEDWAFHLAIYEASGNPMFSRLIQGLGQGFHRFWENPLHQPDFARRGLPYHRMLAERIADRDPEGARTAVRLIMQVLREDVERVVPTPLAASS